MSKAQVLSDEEKAYQDIVEVIGDSTPEQAFAIYLVASSITRILIELAVKAHIKKGNKALRAKFTHLYN